MTSERSLLWGDKMPALVRNVTDETMESRDDDALGMPQEIRVSLRAEAAPQCRREMFSEAKQGAVPTNNQETTHMATDDEAEQGDQGKEGFKYDKAKPGGALANAEPNAPKYDSDMQGDDDVVEWIEALPLHRRVELMVFILIVLAFSATRKPFILRFLSCLVASEILSPVVTWSRFLLNTAEFDTLRVIFFSFSARTEREFIRTQKGGYFRRKFETVWFSVILHPAYLDFWLRFFDNIRTSARDKSIENQNNVLRQLHRSQS